MSVTTNQLEVTGKNNGNFSETRLEHKGPGALAVFDCSNDNLNTLQIEDKGSVGDVGVPGVVMANMNGHPVEVTTGDGIGLLVVKNTPSFIPHGSGGPVVGIVAHGNTNANRDNPTDLYLSYTNGLFIGSRFNIISMQGNRCLILETAPYNTWPVDGPILHAPTQDAYSPGVIPCLNLNGNFRLMDGCNIYDKNNNLIIENGELVPQPTPSK